MTMKNLTRIPAKSAYMGAAAAVSSLFLNVAPAAPPTPEQINAVSGVLSSRVQAAVILGGDYGLGDGNYHDTGNNNNSINLDISKFGGSGDIGDPIPIGTSGIAWQPRLQGSMGYLSAKDNYQGNLPNAGDQNKLDTFAIQFGGGGRFWFNDAFSIAPTFMGMYGNSQNTYIANSVYGQANLGYYKQAGLVDWSANTWTVRPAMNFQYIYRYKRTLITLSSDVTYFYTDNFTPPSQSISISGNSETWETKIDVDTPLGISLFGQELRTGGYYARTQLYDNIAIGLNTQNINEIHGRVVMDFLGQLWKVQWLGVGYSYFWSGNFEGYSVGLDAAFRF